MQTKNESEREGGEARRNDGERAPGRPRIEVVPSHEDLVRIAAELITGISLISIAQRGAFRVALAGGSTPRPIYERLAADKDIDWHRWHIFWSDERCVPPDHGESNFRMVREALLEKINVPPGLMVRMPGELRGDEAAAEYERSLRELVSGSYRGEGVVPRFDLIILGMGADGHTASLFPNSRALAEDERLVVPNDGPDGSVGRLTFTYPLINAARRVLILVSGAEKAETLSQVLSGPHNPLRLPVQAINPVDGQLTWLVDSDAFSQVEASETG